MSCVSHVKWEARRKLNLPGQVVQEIISHLDFLHTGMHAQLCPTLCDYMDCGLPGKNTEVGCHFLLQQIFPTQGSEPISPASPATQADSLPLSHQGSPQFPAKAVSRVHVDVWQKPTQFCKAIILQLKNK